MMKWMKSLRKKLSSDRADSILVPALILAPVLAISVGLAVEVQKNSYVKTERVNAIQDAASSAVGLADSRGSLNWKVVDRIVNEYEHNRFGERVFSATANTDAHYDDLGVKETGESKIFDDLSNTEGGCLVGRGDEAGARYPQYKVTLETARGVRDENAPTVTFTRTQPTLNQLNSLVPLNRGEVYRAVRVEIVDQTPNLVMGIAGVPCQKFDLSASAVTFSADADLPPLRG